VQSGSGSNINVWRSWSLVGSMKSEDICLFVNYTLFQEDK